MARRTEYEAKREAQRKWRERDKRNAVEQLNVRIPNEFRKQVQAFADSLRSDRQPIKAFAAAFPEEHKALIRGAKQHEPEQPIKRAKEKQPPSPAVKEPIKPIKAKKQSP